jgi:hypothetical protein
MKRCACRLAAGRTAVADGTSVVAIRTFTSSRGPFPGLCRVSGIGMSAIASLRAKAASRSAPRETHSISAACIGRPAHSSSAAGRAADSSFARAA